MREGRFSTWRRVTVMATAKDNKQIFPCLSQMMISSWNSFFFHFNYLLLHFPNILSVKIQGAGIQKALQGASDASSCARFHEPGYVSINYKYHAGWQDYQHGGPRLNQSTNVTGVWIHLLSFGTPRPRQGQWPSNTVTLTSCSEEETGWLTPGMWTARPEPYHFFWFASSPILVFDAQLNWMISHIQHLHGPLRVYWCLFVPPLSWWIAESVSWNNRP